MECKQPDFDRLTIICGIVGVDMNIVAKEGEIVGDRFYLEDGEYKVLSANIVRVKLSFENEGSLNDFLERIVLVNEGDFGNIRKDGSKLTFDLCENCIGEIFEAPVYPFDPIDSALIDRCGRELAIVEYLIKLVDAEGGVN